MMRIAHAWGALIGRYGLKAIVREDVRFRFTGPLSSEPCIWVSWHEANLVAMTAYAHVLQRPVVAFAPRGLRGAVMRGWLQSMDVVAIPLADDRDAGVALRKVREALAMRHDVLIAVDGPHGPRRHVKPGALWLAAATGAPLMPVGVAAAPALRLPRWDRHIVPLLGARAMLVVGAPWYCGHATRRSNGLERLARILDELTQRAESAIHKDGEGGWREAA